VKKKGFNRAAELLYVEAERRLGHPPDTDDMVRLYPAIRAQFPVLAKLATTLGLAAPRMRAAAQSQSGGTMKDELGVGTKVKKKSKVTKLAKVAAVAGGLDWAALTKEQKREIKAAVKQDRATKKVQKALGIAPAMGATPAAGNGRAADPVVAQIRWRRASGRR
jgi:hypothetical protein